MSDALQRISGVQIQRSAGEGSTVNIRGLPQVITLLNGEQYLSPGNLGTAQPNLNDIPAQLMNAVVVYKSQDTHNALSGISGTIDLRTRRPFDMKEGFVFSGQGENARGGGLSNTANAGEDERVRDAPGLERIAERRDHGVRLRAGDCAAFPKASGNGHHLQNRSASVAVYLEVGSRHPEDLTTCSDVDMMSANRDGRFVHKDGTPY